MTGAFWYLIRTSMRNRVARQVARLRTPRYAVAFAMGLLYFWFLFLRPQRDGALPPDLGGAMLAFAGVMILGYLVWSWLFGTDRTALAFTRAEVAFLFPAPVSRRALILYKLARSQFGILISVLIWSLLLNRGGTPLSSLLRGAGLWIALSIVSLHRLGIGLWRAGLEEHGAAGAKRSLPVIGVFATAVALVAWTMVSHWDWVANADGFAPAVRALAAITELPPASLVLYPVRLAFAPVLTLEPGPWAVAALQGLLVLALHVWWVLSSDAAFEESAAEHSEQQAKGLEQMRTQRAGGAVVKADSTRRTIPLAAKGAPAIAIVWKNALWLLRTNQLRGILLPPLLLLIATVVFAGEGRKLEVPIAVIGLTLAVIFLFFGPATLRNDLRSDLMHLPMLKTLPIPGRELVLAQVMSGALVVAVAQLLLLGVAAYAFSLAPGKPLVPTDIAIAVVLGAPFALAAVNTVNFTLHNGAALLFPGWVRLGEKGPSGFEATGQTMLTGIATLLALAVLLILPLLAGGGVFVAFTGERGSGVLGGILAGALVLGVEAWYMVGGLGRAFDKVEPMQVAS